MRVDDDAPQETKVTTYAVRFLFPLGCFSPSVGWLDRSESSCDCDGVGIVVEDSGGGVVVVVSIAGAESVMAGSKGRRGGEKRRTE